MDNWEIREYSRGGPVCSSILYELSKFPSGGRFSGFVFHGRLEEDDGSDYLVWCWPSRWQARHFSASNI